MSKIVAVTLTNSSHPDFEYFAEARIDGQQLWRRFNGRGAMDLWVAQVHADATSQGFEVTVTDNAIRY